MSRCVICDVQEGIYSDTAPFIKRKTFPTVRWRDKFNEFQCDDCHSSISNVRKEFKFDPKKTSKELIHEIFKSS